MFQPSDLISGNEVTHYHTNKSKDLRMDLNFNKYISRYCKYNPNKYCNFLYQTELT